LSVNSWLQLVGMFVGLLKPPLFDHLQYAFAKTGGIEGLGICILQSNKKLEV